MISIIIVSYNRLDLVKKCLKMAVGNAPKGTEIILVDNASTEDIPGFVRQKYPNIKLIINYENLGFARGNNLGVAKSKGDYLFFLNTDAFLEPNSLETLVHFLETHPQAGAVGPQLRNADGSIQPSGGYFPHLRQIFLIMTFIDNLPFLRRFTPSIHIRWPDFFTKIQKIDWLSGSTLLIKKDAFEKIGGYDEKIFMYGEELELCYRIKKSGYEVYLNPEVQMVHLGHASSPSESFGIISEMKSFKSFYHKHKPTWQFPILMALMTLGCLLRMGRGLITLNFQMIKTYIQALKQIYQN